MRPDPHRCATCELAEEVNGRYRLPCPNIPDGLSSWYDPCDNCGCIRGGHGAVHPHTRFGSCPGFAPTPPLDTLYDIERSLRAA